MVSWHLFAQSWQWRDEKSEAANAAQRPVTSKEKGLLFLLIGLVSSTLLFLEEPSLKVVFLLALAIWGFCRAYYFAFYVIEHCADPDYRFSRLISFIRYACRKRSRNGSNE